MSSDLVLTHVDAICARIASGMSMRAACESDPAFPTFPAFQTRATRDPVIRAKYQAAKEPWRGNRKLTWLVHFDAIMALIEGGETILSALNSHPEFPSYQSFSTVLKSRSDLAERYRQASRKRQAGPNARSRGTDYTADEIQDAVAEFAKVRTRGTDSIYRSKIGDAGVNVATLEHRSKSDPEVRRAFEKAVAKRNVTAAMERSVEIARRAARSFNPLDRSLKQNAAYHAAFKAMPRGLDPNVKSDVIADICCAVAGGELRVGEIAKRAREFIEAHYRQFSSAKFTSLDGPSAWDPDVAIVDTLTTQEFYID